MLSVLTIYLLVLSLERHLSINEQSLVIEDFSSIALQHQLLVYTSSSCILGTCVCVGMTVCSNKFSYSIAFLEIQAHQA